MLYLSLVRWWGLDVSLYIYSISQKVYPFLQCNNFLTHQDISNLFGLFTCNSRSTSALYCHNISYKQEVYIKSETNLNGSFLREHLQTRTILNTIHNALTIRVSAVLCATDRAPRGPLHIAMHLTPNALSGTWFRECSFISIRLLSFV